MWVVFFWGAAVFSIPTPGGNLPRYATGSVKRLPEKYQYVCV